MTDELIDRFGDPPRPVNNLIAVALLRAAAARCGITSIAQKHGCLLFTVKGSLERVAKLCAGESYKGRLLFSAGEKPYLSLRLRKGEDSLRAAQKLVEDYGKAAAEE